MRYLSSFKLVKRDIHPRHLLRLGGGERDITLRDALAGMFFHVSSLFINSE